MVAKSILSVASKWEKKGKQAQTYKALCPQRPPLWDGWSGFLHRLMAVGHLGWLIGSHCLIPLSGPTDLGEPPLVLRLPPALSTPPCPITGAHRNFPVPSKTHDPGSYEPCPESSRFWPGEYKSERYIKISPPALFPLPFFPQVLG